MTLTTDRQQFEQWWETAMHNGYPPRFGWEHWRDGDGYRDDDGEFQGLWQAWQAGSELLANREAQPVAATPIYQIWDDDGWYDTSEQIWRETYDDFRKEQYRIVYTTPPAPANAKATGYFVRHRSTWNSPSTWSLWTECSGEDYAEYCKRIATGEADAGRFYEARILYTAPPAPAVPDGWKLVPFEPTEEMLRAAYREAGVYSAKAYRAILAAAPESVNGA